MIAYLKWLVRRWRHRRSASTFEDSTALLDLPSVDRLAAMNIDATTRCTRPWRFR